MGLRLREASGTGSTRWRDVFVACRHAPAGSPLAAVCDPYAAWTVTEQIQAARFDQFNMFWWSLGGSKGRKPKPVPRPWDEDTTQHYGAPITRADADAMLARLTRG